MHVGILPLCQPVSPPAYCTKRQRGCQEENQVVIVISVQGSEDKGSTLTGIESSVIEVTDVDLLFGLKFDEISLLLELLVII